MHGNIESYAYGIIMTQSSAVYVTFLLLLRTGAILGPVCYTRVFIASSALCIPVFDKILFLWSKVIDKQFADCPRLSEHISLQQIKLVSA